MHLPQGEEWKINEELRKAHFQGYRDWKGNENWKWRERFKLSASSSGKSYKWRVNVNIPTEKWNTTKESFKLGLDWNYKHPGQSSLSFIHECPSIWEAQAYGHWTYRAQPRSPWAGVSWGRTTMYADPNVSSLWSCLGTAAYKPYEDEGELGKTRYLKNFLEDFFLTRWYNSFSKEKKKIWVKSYTWFCWQSLMSKAEENGQKSLPTGTDYGALFTPEHPSPPSWGSGSHLSFLWGSLLPSENTAAVSLVLLTMNYFSWRRTWKDVTA